MPSIQRNSLVQWLRVAILAMLTTTSLSVASTESDALNALEALSGSNTSENLRSDILSPERAFSSTAWHDNEYLYVGWGVAPGYYLYRNKFELNAIDGQANGKRLQVPQGVTIDDPFFGEVQTHSDPFVSRVPIEHVGVGSTINASISYQGCASDIGICFPLDTRHIEARFQDTPPAQFAVLTQELEGYTSAQSAQEEGYGSYIEMLEEASLPVVGGLFLLAGLALTFTPCVLPMLPIISSIVVGQNASRPRAFLLSSSYVAGMVTMYTAFGLGLGLFGGGLNIQAYLQSPPVLTLFAGVFVLLALVMMGKVQLSMSPALSNTVAHWQSRAQQAGGIGAAIAGALSVLVVSPCVSAPLAGTLMFVSASGDAVVGGVALFAMSLGMGIPLIVAGTFGTALLPKSGNWMNGVKNAFGFMLLGISIWLLSRMLPTTVEWLLWAMLLAAIGITITGTRISMRKPANKVQWLGVIPMMAAGLLLLGATTGAQSPFNPLSGLLDAPDAHNRQQADHSVDSLTDLQSAIQKAEEVGKPAVVYFTADWCPSCATMKNHYDRPEVAEAMQEFVRIDVDVTESSRETRGLMKECGVFGPPGLLFFQGGEQQKALNVYGEMSAEALVEHFTHAEKQIRL